MNKHRLPEMVDIKRLRARARRRGRVRVEAEIRHGDDVFPIHSFTFGSEDPSDPVLLFVGGVHGLERIGTRVLTAYLRTVCRLLDWDRVFDENLKHCRLVFVPLLNPVGMYLHQRSNGAGIDLMRNAPVESEVAKKFQIYAGHRISPLLPWYRGKENEPMAEEARALCEIVRREIWPSRFAISLDVHSGFGAVDRLWFPYAGSRREFPDIASAMALKQLLDRTYPNHVYHFEPQILHYTAHGDLWDYLYDLHRAEVPESKVYLPLSLEIGSWIWIKKNPRQIFSALGAFNPVLPHREQRVLRRHLVLFDFLLRASASTDAWAALSPPKQADLVARARGLWYGKESRAK